MMYVLFISDQTAITYLYIAVLYKRDGMCLLRGTVKHI